MKALRDFIIGLVLAIIGGFIFLSNVTVQGFYQGFFRFSGGMFHTGTTTLGILVILLCIAFFLTVLRPNMFHKILLFSFFILFIVAIILSLNFGFQRMSGFTLFAILALFVGGLALILKAILSADVKPDKEQK